VKIPQKCRLEPFGTTPSRSGLKEIFPGDVVFSKVLWCLFNPKIVRCRQKNATAAAAAAHVLVLVDFQQPLPPFVAPFLWTFAIGSSCAVSLPTQNFFLLPSFWAISEPHPSPRASDWAVFLSTFQIYSLT